MFDYKTLFVSPFMQNCRIFYNTDSHEALVVDPGDNADTIIATIAKLGCTLKAILITHMHLDHVGAVSTLLEDYKVPVLGSAIEDKPIYDALDHQAVAFGLKPCGKFETEWLCDGQEIEPIASIKFKVITTPGHTPGGICFYNEEKHLLVCGDTLFAGSVGRTDFPLGNFEDLIDGIKNKLFTLPPQTVVLSGHGPNSTIEDEIRSNPYVV